MSELPTFLSLDGYFLFLCIGTWSRISDLDDEISQKQADVRRPSRMECYGVCCLLRPGALSCEDSINFGRGYR